MRCFAIKFKGALSGLRPFLATESPLKIMKNAFYFTLKGLFVLKIFKFLSSIFGYVEKQLGLKDKIHFKIYDVTTWETNNWNTYLPFIWRIKGNQTMKFGQLLEYEMRNTFLEKSYAKYGRKTIPRSFSNIQNWVYLWINSLKF